jgi:hypothetical protein
MAVATAPYVPPFELDAEPAPNGPLDEIVFGHWKKAGITPARPCSDAVFLRRAHFDLIGTLPTTREAREFIQDRSPNKRATLVDRLLDRDEFADYWAMRWSDVLRIKAEFPINLWPNAAQAYHRWVRTCMRDNVPYDRFARALLTSSGSNFRVPPVNFYRAMQSRDPHSIAQTVALVFMGTRADRWPRARLDALAAFFARVGYKKTLEWKEEIVFFDADKTVPTLKGVAPAFPDGKKAMIPPGKDPREVFAGWLISPANPWFTRAIVNRLWFWLFGRGIVHEADDIRPDNPPSIPALMAWLEKELIASKYDLRKLMRTIVMSATYQLSAIPRTTSPAAEACFASYPVRRLEAEVLIDALNQITGSTESYSSQIPEPYTFVPESQRSIALPDGSISSSFLEMFGKPARDTGQLSERNNKPSAAQRLHLINSSHIQRKLQQSQTLRALTRLGRTPRESVTTLYLTFLSRFPTAEELSTALRYAQQGGIGRDPGMDIAWALLNSSEFQMRH